MKVRHIVFNLIFMLLALPAFAQSASQGVVVDYNNPKKYIIGGVKIEGTNYFSPSQIQQITGLQEGMEITVPSEELSSVVNRLWLQRYFEDVALAIDSLSAAKDTAFLKVSIIERPRVSKWTFSGVKSGEQKELMDRLNLRRGGEFSEYVAMRGSAVTVTRVGY